jgi:glycosyltransferase involved in cell wall biosynthesis
MDCSFVIRLSLPSPCRFNFWVSQFYLTYKPAFTKVDLEKAKSTHLNPNMQYCSPKKVCATPLVSVIIPAFNAEAYIRRTIDSVLGQTYKRIEVLVVDDGSTDGTAEIVESIAEKDIRIILLRKQNSGVADARNLAIQEARGEYIANIDADDIWYPENIEKQVEQMLIAGPRVGVVYAWSVVIGEDDLLTGDFLSSHVEGEVFRRLVYRYFVGNASASLIRRSCFDKVGVYNAEFKKLNAQGCEDWDLHLRIAECYRFRVLPRFLIQYRQKAGSMSAEFRGMARSHALVLKDVSRRHPEIHPKIYRWSLSCFHMRLAVLSARFGDYRSALSWIHKAVAMDPVMSFLHHNLYAVLARGVAALSFGRYASPFPLGSGSRRTPNRRAGTEQHTVTMFHVNRRMFLHGLSPSQVYEKIRLRKLSRNPGT